MLMLIIDPIMCKCRSCYASQRFTLPCLSSHPIFSSSWIFWISWIDTTHPTSAKFKAIPHWWIIQFQSVIMCLFSTLFDTFLVSNVLAWVPSGKQNRRKRSCLKQFILTNDPIQWWSADTNTETEVELVTIVGNWGLVPLGLPMKLLKCISELFTWRMKGRGFFHRHPSPTSRG